MKRDTIANRLLKNYIVMLLLTTVLTIFVFALIMGMNTMGDPSNIYNQMSASHLMKDNYTQIDTKCLIQYGGGLEVIDSQLNIIYSKGKRIFEGMTITPNDFTNFLLTAKSSPDMITVAYNERQNFWLIVSMPINVKVTFGLSLNTQNPFDKSTLWFLGAFGVGYIAILIISTLIYSRRTATLFVKPLHKLCLDVEEFRKGNYSTRTTVEGNREFGELEKAFNTMAHEVQIQIGLQEKSKENRKNLIRDISHDLKNPLMSITGYAELNLKNDPDNDYAKIIYKNSLRANELVQDLFELSQLESAEFKLEYSACDFIEFFRQEIISMLPELEKRGFELKIQIPEEEVILWIDPKRMRRVITNLVHNAMTYNNDKKQLDITLENREGEMGIIFSNFTDKKFINQEEIFKPFVTQQGSNNNNNNNNNVGLGLAIVKKIITMHRGEVRLNESKDNRFEIEIILKKEEVE